MKKVQNILNKEEYVRFAAYLKEWQVLFGLMDWRIDLNSRPASLSVMACVKIDAEARMVSVRVGSWGAHQITDETLSSTACHELLHVLLYDLINTDQREENAGMMEHKVIHVLERLLATGSNG